MKTLIEKSLQDHLRLAQQLLPRTEEIQKIAQAFINCLAAGGKLIFLGNGGSAADAAHMAAEYVNKFSKDRKSLPALALTTDLSVLTSIANDFEFSRIFSRQLEALAAKNDLVICFSTSGESKNVLQALEFCRQKQIRTVGFTGNSENSLVKLADLSFAAATNDTARIQETYILINHIICQLVDERY